MELRVQATLDREGREYPVEHAKSALPDEAVADRFGRTIVSGGITPPQVVPDDENDTADDPSVIEPWAPVGQREIWLDPAHLRLRQPDKITYGDAS